MAIKCTFYQFAKRRNSTQLPGSFAVKIELDITLKDNCSVVNPEIIVDSSNLADDRIFRLNYAYIPDFNRYYFVHDWEWISGLWKADLSVDVLASWRTNILGSRFYIMRSTYDNNGNVLYDGSVSDSKYPVTAAQPTFQASSVNNPYAIDDSFSLAGTFVVGVINANSQNGAVSYYAMNTSSFLEFCQKLFNYSSGWLNISTSEISEALQKALVNPFQYVVSCVYLPIDISEIATIAFTTTQTINFGWWSVSIYGTARIVNSAMYLTKTNSLTIPRHPLAATRGNYLNTAPYSIYTLRYYPFGTIDIDSEAIANWNTLDLYSSVDIVTGKGVLDIAVNGRNNPIRTIEAQIGVNVPTASLQTTLTNIASGKSAAVVAGAAAVGNINLEGGETPNPADYTGNISGFLRYARDSASSALQGLKQSFQPGNIKKMASDIMNTALAASTTAEIQGMQGTGSLFQAQTLTLSGRFLPVASEDFDHIGRPLMQLRQLSTLSGFCLCSDVDISAPCTVREKEAINAYLSGGFFIE